MTELAIVIATLILMLIVIASHDHAVNYAESELKKYKEASDRDLNDIFRQISNDIRQIDGNSRGTMSKTDKLSNNLSALTDYFKVEYVAEPDKVIEGFKGYKKAKK